MNFELLRVAAAVLGTGAAAWEDHKTSFIDDRITFSMIGIGFVLNAWAWLAEGDGNFFSAASGPALIILGAGYLLYRLGQLGGGDVLLFAGLQLLLPVYPAAVMTPIHTVLGIEAPFLVSEFASAWPFFGFLLLSSSLLALLGSALQYAVLLWQKHKNFKGLNPDWLTLALMAFVLTALLTVMARLSSPPGRLVFLATFSGLCLFMAAFKKQVMDEIVIQKIRIEEIEDEDILALDKMDEKIVKKYGLERVLTKEQVEKLKKIRKEKKIARFPVCKVLPRFGPYLFAALVLDLVLGSFLLVILEA